MDELELLREQLRKMMNDLSDHMSTGGCKEYSEYTRCCGMIEGLATAERELLDLKKKLEEA
jgi:hypothetical protein|tara:strand:+ start:456 stop:638 length:183 start_codon:yes stop_codon:yes gene_type:complete